MKYRTSHHIEYLDVNLFDESKLFTFFTTRNSGVSTGEYGSLNLGNTSDDNIQLVRKNRELLCNMLDISSRNLIIPRQTHSANVLVVSSDFISLTEEEQAACLNNIDALITNIPEICIGVTTADCVPVLIYDPKQKVLAAVHAGWKGTVANIVGETVTKMQACFNCNSRDMLAAIGPSISIDCFEVGEEVVSKFADAGYNMSEISYRNMSTGKTHIDLWKANSIQLEKSGILARNIQIAEICTYSNPDKFFSARRQTIHSGRMLAGGLMKIAL